MKATIKWVGDVQFTGESGSGHTLSIDGPPEEGGTNAGFRPMELVLMGVAGCSSFDVVKILRKARQPVTDCIVQVEARRSDEIPSVFTNIHLHFVISGANGLKENQVERAIRLSAEKYCSASIMLARGGVEITHDYEIQIQ